MTDKNNKEKNICPVCKEGKLKKLNKFHTICTNPNCYQFFEVQKTVKLTPVD
ncbi:MAG: hypothetical protein GF317_19255 [Candidatus Lokiarchaeota archaeon]|nr:hypothetical protein [Candidatus Lokiarchaeota archaeon]